MDADHISTPSLGFPPESPGYGEWAKIGGHTYAITFHTLYGDGAGNFGGRGKVRATVTVGPNGDDVSGVFQVDIFDAAGVLAASDTGTVKGPASAWRRCRRCSLEPIDEEQVAKPSHVGVTVRARVGCDHHAASHAFDSHRV